MVNIAYYIEVCKNDAFVAKIAIARMAQTFMAIFACCQLMLPCHNRKAKSLAELH